MRILTNARLLLCVSVRGEAHETRTVEFHSITWPFLILYCVHFPRGPLVTLPLLSVASTIRENPGTTDKQSCVSLCYAHTTYIYTRLESGEEEAKGEIARDVGGGGGKDERRAFFSSISFIPLPARV